MTTQQKHMYVRKASAGTGKTFTLAAHYIALLLHGEHYRSILAVTFTNKATAEMKQRIIAYLYAIAHNIHEPSTQGFLHRVREIAAELGFPANEFIDSECQRKAGELHANLLIHYDEMHVQTIDSFLQSLLSGMVLQMDGAVGYQVELEVKRVISDAVDELLTTGAQDPAICKQLTRYIGERISDEKGWDIRKGLNEIGEEIFKELLQENETCLVYDETLLTQLRQRLDWHNIQEYASMQNVLNQVAHLQMDDFKTRGKDYINCIERIRKSMNDESNDSKDIFRAFTAACADKIANPSLFAQDCNDTIDNDTICHLFNQIQELAPALRAAKLRHMDVCKYLNDLALMKDLKDRIYAHLTQTNTRLLATTANTLAKALQAGDADFILEKAGIRYRHIMLDEFQDTSTLQWENFKKLLQEILSTTDGSTLIVGDIKQSIYRWRNGNWEIMNNLQTEWPNYYTEPDSKLICNRRSCKEVVKFNLETMQLLSGQEDQQIQDLFDEGYSQLKDNLSSYYVSPDHDGGFVQVRCYAQTSDAKLKCQVRGNMLLDMLGQIDRLLSTGVHPEDIMILVRKKKEAKEVIDAIRANKLSFQKLTDNSIQSQDCFQLQFSTSVNMLVSAIRYIYTDDGPSLTFVRNNAPELDIQSARHQLGTMALTDLIEYLIHHCNIGNDVEDLSYINSFRDKMRKYVQANGSDGIAFLRYWDDKMNKETIPAVNANRIRMMTIHAAKGLEADNVFIPFCDWDMEEDKQGSKLWCGVPELMLENDQPALLPIPQNSTTAEAGFAAEYNREHHLQRIDNLNLLYVAITRAAKRLFIWADVTNRFDSNKKEKERQKWNVGQMLAERCGLWPELDQLFIDLKAQQKEWEDPKNFVQFTTDNPSWEDIPKTKVSASNTIPSHCYSSDSRIEFRQSQDSRKYGWDIAQWTDDQLQLEDAAFGTLCHNIMETIGLYPSKEDAIKAANAAVDTFYNNGLIPTPEIRETIRPLLVDTVTHLFQWFSGNWLIQCEESVLFQDRNHAVKECRMDRVMWSPDRSHAIVLDYKFGHDNIKYDTQVRDYMTTCLGLGAQTVEGYLWIAKEHRLEPIHL